MQLTVSYEIPEILIPVATVCITNLDKIRNVHVNISLTMKIIDMQAIKPFLEGLLAQGLQRFSVVAKEYHRKILQR